MNYFYAPSAGSSDIYKLDEREAHHAMHVLRLKEHNLVYLLDGAGNLYEAEMIETRKKNCSVRILQKQTQPKQRNYYLHIAIAPTKSSDRFDFFLEKATEIGIDEITPIITQNSERRKLNTGKLEQTIISAIKQSGNAWLPKLNEPAEYKSFLKKQADFRGEKMICHCLNGDKLTLTKSYQALHDVMMMIGPEGDFTQDEVILATQHGYTGITLGKMRLRTETAGILACSMIQTINLFSE